MLPSAPSAMRPPGEADWPIGKWNPAAVAGPPSLSWQGSGLTVSAQWPMPAIVEMTSVARSTLRIIWFAWSAISRLPARSKTTPTGRSSVATSAGPPSPPKPRLPLPQMSITAPVAMSARLMRLLCQAAITSSLGGPSGSNATLVGWLSRLVDGSSDDGPSSPMPATMRMRPSASMTRMRWLFQSTT